MDENERFGVVLSTTPPIVECILKNLRMRDLYSCAKVCKLWNNIVHTIKKNRKDIFWSLVDYDWCCFADSSETIDDDDKIYSAHPWDIPTPLRVFFHVDLARASSDPKFALLFCSHQLLTKLQKFIRHSCSESESNEARTSGAASRKREKPFYNNKVMDFLSNHMPETCNTLFCAAQGIVGTPFNKTQPEEIESSPALGGIFFPSLNGVDVYQFPINNKMCLNCLPAATGIPEEQKVKCMFVFTKSIPQRKGSTCRLIDHYLKEQKNDMALGGAIVDDLCCRSSSKTFTGVGVAFAGDNIKATSVILKGNVRTWASAEKQLRKLQSCSVLGDQNCAFMFACVARGSGFYNDSNVEASVFHKLFPTVPLFGVFGNGEIGVEYLPNNSALKKDKEGKTPVYLHSYSTVFVLLSIKR